MRQVARQEHKRPWPGPESVLAALYVQGPREDVEALVLAAVGVSGRPAVDGGLDHGEAAAGGPAGRLHVGSPAGHALTWADDVSTGDGLVRHSGLPGVVPTAERKVHRVAMPARSPTSAAMTTAGLVGAWLATGSRACQAPSGLLPQPWTRCETDASAVRAPWWSGCRDLNPTSLSHDVRTRPSMCA